MQRLLTLLLFLPFVAIAENRPTPIDTLIRVDAVQVTAIKQGLQLRNQPVTASIFGQESIERQQIKSIRDVSTLVPNFYIPEYGSRMTSSIYIRGLGARIDQPVMGMNLDNVPFLNKEAYDIDMLDIERIEVLRGPQSTLYGRNTMGGVINVYTLSPLTYEGARIGATYGSGNSYKIHASTYTQPLPGLGLAVTGYYSSSDGFFRNDYDNRRSDWEHMGGGQMKLQWRGRRGLMIDNTLSFSALRQGGYPYAALSTGQINYNDTCSYRRICVSDGFTLRYENEHFAIASITSYQYIDDEMVLDQDFLPDSYFTLHQARSEHAMTEDLVFKSVGQKAYRWLFGAFGFYKHSKMHAPVLFKEDGIQRLISDKVQEQTGLIPIFNEENLLFDSHFRNPTFGTALYHESNFDLGRWHFTAGLRADFEWARLNYTSATKFACKIGENEIIPFTQRGQLKKSFVEILPKVSILYHAGQQRRSSIYLSISKGYKAGGFNTQMFSEVLQNALMEKMNVFSDTPYNIDQVVAYKPEKSWNYELGSHIENNQGSVRADLALFYIDCRDQQLTVFPAGQTTGRMMTNAGKTRSWGGEFSFATTLWRSVDLTAAYGYTNAKFVEFRSGKEDFAGKYIPYAPRHTLAASVAYTIPLSMTWLDRIVLRAGIKSTGEIAWNEANTRTQPFYTLLDASIRFEHRHYAIDLWGRNLTDQRYDVFYFLSIQNEFVQRGRPRTFGVTLTIKI
ncbi:MAG: TonB-dependent receptor [Alistipes sp.]